MRKKVAKNAQCAEESYMRVFYAEQRINLSCTQDTISVTYSVHKTHFTCKDFCLLKMIFFFRKHNSITECEEKLEKSEKEKLAIFAKLELKN